MRTLLLAACLGLFSLSVAGSASAHCQVPCGIYDDAARIAAMREDATTISKAMKSIIALTDDHSPQGMNQVVRWINTKEEHASMIITTVSEYFLTQKLKPVAAGAEGRDEYVKSLEDHHALLRAAMKAKQSVEKEDVDALLAAIDAVAAHWGDHQH